MDKFWLIMAIVQFVIITAQFGYKLYKKQDGGQVIRNNVAFFAAMILAVFIWYNYGLNKQPVVTAVVKDKFYYEKIVEKKAIEHNIPISIAKSLVTQESNWKPNVISYAQAVGLCQVLPSTFIAYSDEGFNIMEPSDNIEVSFRYLEDLQSKNKNWNKTLGMYNGGKYWKTGECQKYANDILLRAASELVCMK